MDAATYFHQNPDLAALNIALFFFLIGVVIGWVLWAGNRQQLEIMELDNDTISRQIESARLQQAQIERQSSEIGCDGC